MKLLLQFILGIGIGTLVYYLDDKYLVLKKKVSNHFKKPLEKYPELSKEVINDIKEQLDISEDLPILYKYSVCIDIIYDENRQESTSMDITAESVDHLHEILDRKYSNYVIWDLKSSRLT